MKKLNKLPDAQKAISLFQQGKFDDSKLILHSILNSNPAYAHGWFILGIIFTQQNEYDSAVSSLRKAIEIQPVYPDAFNNLGVILEKQNKKDEAKKSYITAIKQKHDYPSALYNLGNIYKDEGDFDSAINVYLKAISFNPGYTNAIINLGVVYQQLRQYKKSIDYFESALTLSPNDATILNNLGLSYYYLFDYDKALEIFRKIPENSPDWSTTYLNLGQIYQARGEFTRAKEYYLKAAKDPIQQFRSYNNIALMELANLNLEEGWHYYKYRKSIQDVISTIPDYLPTNLKGKTILVTKDQGLGDEIFFLRFINELVLQGATVTYLTDSRLFSILTRSFKNIKIIDSTQPNIKHDYTLPVSELPRLLFNKTSSQIPPSINLTVNKYNLEAIKHSFPNNNKRNIAIAWQAGTEKNNYLFKRIDPELLGKMLSSVDANILVIQRAPSKSDVKRFEKALGRKSFNFAYVNENIEDSLALLSLIDDIVSVSNTNIHLAVALGKSAKILVPHPPEWRWATKENASPWFPDFQLFRQSDTGDWRVAIDQCQSALFEKLYSH